MLLAVVGLLQWQVLRANRSVSGRTVPPTNPALTESWLFANRAFLRQTDGAHHVGREKSHFTPVADARKLEHLRQINHCESLREKVPDQRNGMAGVWTLIRVDGVGSIASDCRNRARDPVLDIRDAATRYCG